MVAARHIEQRIGLSATLQVCPLQDAPPCDSESSLPRFWRGAGKQLLMYQRLQLLFFQLGSEFPFDPFRHLLPGAPGGFHLFQHRQGLGQ